MVTTFTHYHCEKLQQESAGDKVTLRDVIEDKNIRRPIIIGCVVMLASVSTGIVAIFTCVLYTWMRESYVRVECDSLCAS